MNYVDRIARQDRLLRGRENAAKRGRAQGRIPFGYSRPRGTGMPNMLVPHAAEAHVVRLIFATYLREKGIKAVLRQLLSFRTRRGTKWSRAGVAWILHNPVYVGRVRFAKIEVRGMHEALVTHKAFAEAQEIMKKNLKNPRRSKVTA